MREVCVLCSFHLHYLPRRHAGDPWSPFRQAWPRSLAIAVRVWPVILVADLLSAIVPSLSPLFALALSVPGSRLRASGSAVWVAQARARSRCRVSVCVWAALRASLSKTQSIRLSSHHR
jgi:hypothetical protein